MAENKYDIYFYEHDKFLKRIVISDKWFDICVFLQKVAMFQNSSQFSQNDQWQPKQDQDHYRYS